MMREPFKLEVYRLLAERGNDSCIGVMFCDELRQTLVTVENRKFLIPDGKYLIDFTLSPRFSKKYPYSNFMGGLVPLIIVPGHEGIRIHIANYGYELTGCVGVGRTMNFNMVGESRVAYMNLMAAITSYDRTADKGWVEFHTLETCHDIEYIPV